MWFARLAAITRRGLFSRPSGRNGIVLRVRSSFRIARRRCIRARSLSMQMIDWPAARAAKRGGSERGHRASSTLSLSAKKTKRKKITTHAFAGSGFCALCISNRARAVQHCLFGGDQRDWRAGFSLRFMTITDNAVMIAWQLARSFGYTYISALRAAQCIDHYARFSQNRNHNDNNTTRGTYLYCILVGTLLWCARKYINLQTIFGRPVDDVMMDPARVFFAHLFFCRAKSCICFADNFLRKRGRNYAMSLVHVGDKWMCAIYKAACPRVSMDVYYDVECLLYRSWPTSIMYYIAGG